ncbi:MAG: hypothetical protein KGI27_10105 [Thaumarchaeota archaeon]|nr:hypothetical protein [Nitrososphaerota archaeon]
MKVTGPNWPSTHALAEALKDVPGPDLRWGQGAKDGLTQLRTFTASHIACPEWTSDLAQAKKWVRAGVKVFGRRLHHTHGSDIIGPGYKAERWNREWTQRDFWVKVIDSVAEYRQHVWDGRAIRIGKKAHTGESWRKNLVRSRNNGWTIDYSFKSPSEPFTDQIRQLSKAAVTSVGYLGGAVDILEGRDGKLYVLEVNSAPSLRDEHTLGAYVQAIQRWVKREAKKANGKISNTPK